MSQLSVALLVLFFEKVEQTIECLQSFEGSSLQIYLLDNGSSIEARQTLDAYARNRTNILVIRESANIGVGPGRNRLIATAKEDWLFFVDSDIVIKSQDWMNSLISHISQNPSVEVFIPRYYNLHEKQWMTYSDFEVVGCELRRKSLCGSEMNNFPGGAAIVKRSLFYRLGYYDESIFVGGEDFEICLRGMFSNQPVKGLLVDDIFLIHDHRRAKNLEEVSAILTRYDDSLLEKSFQYVGEKYGIVFNRGWQAYASNQRCQMGVETSRIVMGKYLFRRFLTQYLNVFYKFLRVRH